MNWIYFGLLIAGTVVLVIICAVITVKIGSRWEAFRAQQRVEARFLKVWDRRREHKLLALQKVQRQLVDEHAPTVELEAVKQRIQICRNRHTRRMTQKLPSGRTIIISKLNYL